MLRRTRLQRILQLFQSRLGEDRGFIPQQVIRMHLVAGHQFDPGDIARAQLQIAVVLCAIHQQRRLAGAQLAQRFAERPGLGRR